MSEFKEPGEEKEKSRRRAMTPLRAIRAKCLECTVGSTHEVRLCPTTDCSLYLYRFGHNPKRAGIGRRNGRFRKKTLVE